MKKILLTCGAGASSGFMAQSMRKAALKKDFEVEIIAKSDAEIFEYMDGADILLIGPHLKHQLPKLKEKLAAKGIPVALISQAHYGQLDGEGLLNEVIEEMGWSEVDLATQPEIQEAAAAKEQNQKESAEKTNEKGFMGWMKDVFAPKMNQISKNDWISSIQESIMALLPFIMVGSLANFVSVFKNWLTWIPDISAINSFTFGLLSLYIAFLVPNKIMAKKQVLKLQIPACLTSISLYMMLVMPLFEDGRIQIITQKVGAGGMLVSLVVSVFVSFVMYKFSKFSFFKKTTSMPDIVVSWIDSMVPIFLILLLGLVCYLNSFDVYAVIQGAFAPITQMGQTLPGIVLCSFIVCFLFSFGISWVMFPIMWPIWMQGIEMNAELVAAGEKAVNLNIMEFFHGFLYLGGQGATLTLVLMMLFSRSKRLKAIGRITILPSIFNINEPVMFGAPIVWNPILMIPYWICGLVLPIIGYAGFYFGLVTVPSSPFQLWYMPTGIYAYIATNDVRSFLLIGLILLASFMIYLPFFKVYEAQEFKKEQMELEE